MKRKIQNLHAKDAGTQLPSHSEKPAADDPQRFHCLKCGCRLMVKGKLCITCYRSLTVRCTQCCTPNGKIMAKYAEDRFGVLRANCSTCKNERFITLPYE